jgi:glycosyltransferase involved in cell wall biosynthesis
MIALDPLLPAVRKLKILHVLEATLGGTLRYLNDIIKASDSRVSSYAIAYATERADPDLAEMLDRAVAAGWTTFCIDMVRAVTPQKDVRSVIELRRVISEFVPDVLHCHSSKAGAVGRIGRLLSVDYPKVVYSPHAIAANLGSQYLFIERVLRPFTARYAAVSESEKNELVFLKIGDAKTVDIVYPTIDTIHFAAQEQQAVRAQLSLPVDADIIVGVGRLVKQKNPLFFLEVVKRIASNQPSVKAIWVGEGEMRSDIEAAIVALGLTEIVTLAGWQADVRPYIAASNVLLSSSLYESFGYMVAEACAMERPVVASNVTGTRDILTGPLAEWMYAPGDADEAATLIEALLGDRAMAEKLGAFGREEMRRRFNREAMAQALNDVYWKAVKS